MLSLRFQIVKPWSEKSAASDLTKVILWYTCRSRARCHTLRKIFQEANHSCPYKWGCGFCLFDSTLATLLNQKGFILICLINWSLKTINKYWALVNDMHMKKCRNEIYSSATYLEYIKDKLTDGQMKRYVIKQIYQNVNYTISVHCIISSISHIFENFHNKMLGGNNIATKGP